MPEIPFEQATVVLPTYNEAGNVKRLTLAALAALPPTAGVLIVDDSSPDGTGRIADELAAADKRVDVLHRPRKEGLGPAYLAGFRRALASDSQLILEMDADFSHDPRDLPRLIAGARTADLVIGSRYVEGGGTANWGLARRLVSRGGCAYARGILDVPVHDLTGGFKCFRREVLEKIDFDSIGSKGYAFQIEMTYRAARLGFEIVEIPIVFRDREVNESKMGWPIVAEAALTVPRLRLSRRPAAELRDP